MLIRFIVSNFLSFRDETEFNMLTGTPRRHQHHIYHYNNIHLLKTGALYGANGAGKSNLVKALDIFKYIVKDGSYNPNDIARFRLHNDYNEMPTTFEVEFIKNGTTYAYFLSITPYKILEEELYITHPKKDDELILSRYNTANKKEINLNDAYLQSEEDKTRLKIYEEEFLNDNCPLLHILANSRKEYPDLKDVYQWFKYNLITIFPQTKPKALIGFIYESADFRAFCSELMGTLQTGVHDIQIETFDLDEFFGEDDKKEAEHIKQKLQKDPVYIFTNKNNTNEKLIATKEGEHSKVSRVVMRHQNDKGEYYHFHLDEESDGTLRIFDLLLALYSILNHENTVFVDEIDQSIHPYLLKQFIEKFINDRRTKGQLIFTTHESNLLDLEIFRQDEIWFVEKNHAGASVFYPLSEFKPRYDKDIQKGYINGRFGAIPFMGNFKDLNWFPDAQKEK